MLFDEFSPPWIFDGVYLINLHLSSSIVDTEPEFGWQAASKLARHFSKALLYAANSPLTEYSQLSASWTLLLPNSPIVVLCSGSPRSIRIFSAKSWMPIKLSAYKEAPMALNLPSFKSNWTIGLPNAMYSIILIIVETSFISQGLSGLTQTSEVERPSKSS